MRKGDDVMGLLDWNEKLYKNKHDKVNNHIEDSDHLFWRVTLTLLTNCTEQSIEHGLHTHVCIDNLIDSVK